MYFTSNYRHRRYLGIWKIQDVYKRQGNVRELRQKVMGAVLQAQEGVVMKEHLELAVTKPTSTVSFALRNDLIANAFKVGKADPTLFTKTCDGDLFVCQIYVDDIIFGSTNQKSCEELGG